MAVTHIQKTARTQHTKSILCRCGSALTIATHYGKRGDIDVVNQCDCCMMEAYNVGYTDGGVSATQKSTLASIMAATDPLVTSI